MLNNVDLVVCKAEEREQMNKQVVDAEVHASGCQDVIGYAAREDPMGVVHNEARKDHDGHTAECEMQARNLEAKQATHKAKEQAANEDPEPDREKSGQEGEVFFADQGIAR